MFGWKDLEIPIGWLIILFEAVRRQKPKTGSFVAGGKDAHVTFNELLTTGTAFRHTLRTMVENDTFAIVGEALDISSEPRRMTRAYLVQHIVIDHWCLGEQAFATLTWWTNVCKIPVEEETQKILRDPGEDRLRAEDVQGQQYINDRVSGNYPLLGSGQDVRLLSFSVGNELESFYCGSTTTLKLLALPKID